MDKMEYGDFHKFIVSLGIASLALAFIVPWLFLKEPFDLLLESKKITELTAVAQEALKYRQDAVYSILGWLPYISAALIAIGLILIICGLPKWSKKQGVTDALEKTNLDLKTRELEKMTAQETEDKTVSESVQGGQGSPAATPNKAERIKESLKGNETMMNEFKIKEVAYKKISEQFKDNYSISENQKIGELEFDIVAQSNESKAKDILFEIRYLRIPVYEYVVDTVNRTVYANRGYEEALGRKAKSVILFFADKGINIEEFEKRARKEEEIFDNAIAIRFIPVEDIEKADYTKLLHSDCELLKMNSVICSAIKSRKIVKFSYNGSEREAEPYCYGVGSTGNELLRAYQIGGAGKSENLEGWRLFKVNEISNISMTDRHFPENRPYYNPNDKAMAAIYCNI